MRLASLSSLSAFALLFFALASLPATAQVPGVFFANQGEPNQVCTDDGTGTLACAQVSTRNGFSLSATAGDFDGDGDDDVVAGSFFQASELCINDGPGTFTCSNLPGGNPTVYDLDAFDADGDGDLDLALAIGFGPNRLCTNDGSAGFTCAAYTTDGETSLGITTFDADNDGDLDLAVAERGNPFGTPDTYCENDGTGAFTCNDIAPDTTTYYAVSALDADNDGNADLAFGGADLNRICLGDGAGSFSCSTIPGTEDESRGSDAADFDGDGNIDVAFSNLFPGPSLVCFGDGTGSFSCTDIANSEFNGNGLAAGDLDDDGDADLAIAAFNRPAQLCSNDGTGLLSCSDIAGAPSQRGNEPAIGNFSGAPLAGGFALTVTAPPSVAPGAALPIVYTVANNTGSAASGDFFFTARRNGNVVAQQVVQSGTVPAGQTLLLAAQIAVPSAAPEGAYELTFAIGQAFGQSVDTEVLTVTVQGAARPGTPAWSVIEATPWTEDGAPVATATAEVTGLTAYPNPTAGRAEVAFALAEAAAVRLVVFDVLGREVAVLAEGAREAGPHTAAFDGSALAAGTYLVRLEAGGVVETQTLTLTR
ncbi:MAG: T9SS type A sorting domain-containing protein [Bacteroidota bacterium]